MGNRRWQILGLMAMAVVGIVFGVWLFREGFVGLGCFWMAVFLWRAQQFAVWFISPIKAPSNVVAPLASKTQRMLLSVICLIAASVCAVGIYLCRLYPEDWQAGFVIVLFGLVVLAPVTLKEVQLRRQARVAIRFETPN
jgi:hypothetical protein